MGHQPPIKLPASPAELADIAIQYGTPLYVYNAETIRQEIKKVRAAFQPIDVEIRFFEFANRNTGILRLLTSEGVGVSVARPTGIMRCLKLGVPRENIECSGHGFSKNEIDQVLETGVSINFGTKREIELAAESKFKRPIGVRVDLGVTKDDKRGLTMEQLKQTLNENRIPIEGIHTYIGSNKIETDEHVQTLKRLVDIIGECPDEVRRQISYLNVGGGFGYDYHTRTPFEWIKYAKEIKTHWDRVKGASTKKLELKLEIGRALVVAAGCTVVTIIDAYEKNGREYIVVDSNISHISRPVRYGFHVSHHPYMAEGFHTIVGLNEREGERARNLAVVGNSHYSKDWIGFTCIRADKLEDVRGDLIVVLDTGAYTEAMADTWADEPRPASVLLDGSISTLIARREEIDDLIAPPRESELE